MSANLASRDNPENSVSLRAARACGWACEDYNDTSKEGYYWEDRNDLFLRRTRNEPRAMKVPP